MFVFLFLTDSQISSCKPTPKDPWLALSECLCGLAGKLLMSASPSGKVK